MKRFCNLEQLSADGRWEEVFICLGIDPDDTIELTDLDVPNATMTAIKHSYLGKVNPLDIILPLIWFIDQCLWNALIVYCALLAKHYLGLVLSATLLKCRKYLSKMKSQ